MADLADAATLNIEQHDAAAMLRIAAAIPAGVPGECDDCGELMPRLVDGRCGFCRDGRRPPPERYDRADCSVGTLITPRKDDLMPSLPNTATSQTISVPAKDRVLAAIRARAAGDDLPLGQAVLAIVEDWLDATNQPKAGVGEIATADLLIELQRRVVDAIAPEALAAAEARAEAAEGKLALVGGVLSGHVQSATRP